MEKEVLTFKEACAFLSISKNTLLKLIKEDRLPHARTGKKLVFIKAELLKWLKSQSGK